MLFFLIDFQIIAASASLEENCANPIFLKHLAALCFPSVPNQTSMCEIFCLVEELQRWKTIAVIDIICKFV